MAKYSLKNVWNEENINRKVYILDRQRYSISWLRIPKGAVFSQIVEKVAFASQLERRVFHNYTLFLF